MWYWWGRRQISARLLWGNLKEKNIFEKLDIDTSILLKWVWKNPMRGSSLDSVASDYKQMAGFCRHVNEHLTPTIFLILQSLLRQVHSLFQSELSAQRELESPLSIYGIFTFPVISTCLHLLPRLPVTFIFPFFFPPITCFRSQFLCKI
jgi:hypothetical protein